MRINQVFLGIANNFSFLQITGAQAATFLQGQLTCDIRNLDANQAIIAACCDHKGRILFNGWLGRWQQDYVLLLPASMLQRAIAHLQKYAVFSKVILSEKLDWQGLIYCGAALPSLQNFPCLQAKLPLMGQADDFMYWLLGPTETMQAIQHDLAKPAAALEPDLLEYFTVLANLVFIQPATSELFIPQMIGLEKLGGVSLNKGCYVGQEIIARTTYLGQLKRHLQMVQMPISPTPPLIGDPLFNEQQEIVGQIAAIAQDGKDHFLVLAVIQDRALPHSLFNNLAKRLTLSFTDSDR